MSDIEKQNISLQICMDEQVYYDLINQQWEDLNPFEGGARCAAVGFAPGNGKGYVGLGINYMIQPTINYTDFWEYDPTTDDWTQRTNYPNNPEPFANDLFALVIDGNGYIGGGQDAGVNSFNIYNHNNNFWNRKDTLPGGDTFRSVSFTIGQTGYVGTGETGGSFAAKNFWAYGPLTNTWSTVAGLDGAGRRGAFEFTIGNKAYVGGGFNNVLGYLVDVWEYKATLD